MSGTSDFGSRAIYFYGSHGDGCIIPINSRTTVIDFIAFSTLFGIFLEDCSVWQDTYMIVNVCHGELTACVKPNTCQCQANSKPMTSQWFAWIRKTCTTHVIYTKIFFCTVMNKNVLPLSLYSTDLWTSFLFMHEKECIIPATIFHWPPTLLCTKENVLQSTDL